MTLPEALQLLSILVLAVPAGAVIGLGALVLLGHPPSERASARLATWSLGIAFASAVVVGVALLTSDVDRVDVHLGSWFQVGSYRFEITLLVDRLSLPFALLTTLLTGVVARFSTGYMHRERGYTRFFLLLLLFATGMLLLTMAGSIDLLFAGWEIVGLTSVLLIAFFHRRREPVLNGLRTFAIYRVCDVGLLVAAVLMHHYAHSAEFEGAFGHVGWPAGLPNIEGPAATSIALLLVFAAMGKSAQVPFSGWLPRAMEGPTSSSAIFYGGLSIHAGAYLLLRTSPILEQSPLATTMLVIVGSMTAIYASLVGRVQTDAKNQLAFASMVQVGIILAEIGLGLRFLALLHIAGHACIRTLQLLKAPSLLNDYHQIHAAAGGELKPTGIHFELLLRDRWRRRLYAVALHRGGLDALLEQVFVRPIERLSAGVNAVERRFTALFEGAEAGSTDPNASLRSSVATTKEVQR